MARRSRPPRRRAPRAKPARPARAATGSAEALLLALARDLTARAAHLTRAADLRAVVDALAAAYGPESPLAAAMRKDWLRGRSDKNVRLALGWAREQVRLAMVDVVQRAAWASLVSAHPNAETLAWLSLACCEALAYEPASAVGDRVQALSALLGAI